jgi:uncharacterized protein YbjT (DUF2867 family)
MKILVTGATGFIGRHICARLLRDGHRIMAAVRDTASIARRFPGIDAVRIDMNRMASAAAWQPLLAGIDAVVNCAGILQSGAGQSATAIHADAPKALFDACLASGVRRVVQISAVSADVAAGTEYALSKQAADDYLRTLDLDWIVLRPSLIYAAGSYGGTSVIRGLAGLPWIIPLIGRGDQKFQPLHADDFAETVRLCLTSTALARTTLDPVGPETLCLREIVVATRAWLDLPPARLVHLPLGLIRLAARVGDLTGKGPLRTTSLVQMDYGNVSDAAGFARAIGFRPRSMSEAFRSSPSHVQDRWQARLFFLRPALTAALALLWLGSGVLGIVNPPQRVEETLQGWGFPASLVSAASIGFSALDIAIGILLATGWSWRNLGFLQVAIVVGYTIGLGFLAPALLADPLGALLKNLPILAAIGVWAALQDDR